MILVMASYPATRDAIVPLIADKGYRVNAVDCGDEFLARVRFQPPSLIILDCDVPDSFEMLGKIKSEARVSRIPVVMFSESGGNVKEKSLGKGADSFVAKGSLDWIELISEIVRLIGPPESHK